jgi:hypothetical protein
LQLEVPPKKYLPLTGIFRIMQNKKRFLIARGQFNPNIGETAIINLVRACVR